MFVSTTTMLGFVVCVCVVGLVVMLISTLGNRDE